MKLRFSFFPLLALLVGLFAFGCFQSKYGEPPPYQPSGVQTAPQQTTPVQTPAQPPEPEATPEAPQNQSLINTTERAPGEPEYLPYEGGNITPEEQPSSSQAISNATNASAPPAGSEYCEGLEGNPFAECINHRAVSQKDVSLCTLIKEQDSRFRCITIWCSSAGRNFNGCYNLTDYDDRIGCLNKCNPNTNT